MIISISQIIIAVLLIILILLQQKEAALGSAFGGSDASYSTRRGIQKKIFWATIFCAFLFILFAVLNLVF